MSHEGGGVRLPHVHELPAPSGAARPQLRGLTLCPVAARWGAAAWLGYPFAVCTRTFEVEAASFISRTLLSCAYHVLVS